VNVPTHGLPAEVFAGIASGGGGPAAIRRLAAVRRSRTVLLIRAVRDLAADAGHPQAGIARAAYRSLARTHRLAPAATERLLTSPLVGAWTLTTAAALAAGAGELAHPELLAAVAASAALGGRVATTVALPPLDRATSTVVLPAAGTATFPGGCAAEVSFRSDGAGADLVAGTAVVRVPADPRTGAAGWRGVPRISLRCEGLGLDVCVEALTWSGLGAGADLRPDDQPLQAAWRDQLAAGWRVLATHHPQVAAEVGAGLTMIAPLAGRAAVRRSATFRNAFGCLAMTAPSDPCWVALTFAHEIQHAKLTVVTDLVRLTEPGTQRYYAPWREDPRPLDGLLHGAYAHLGVAGFWRRQRWHQPGADGRFLAQVEYVRWLEASLEAIGALRSSGGLTAAGLAFVTAMEQVLRGWVGRRDVPADAVALARDRAAEHRTRWQDRAPGTGSLPGRRRSPAVPLTHDHLAFPRSRRPRPIR
jgi:HEXXH motif-containing protein